MRQSNEIAPLSRCDQTDDILKFALDNSVSNRDLVFDENNVLMGYDDNNKTATVTVNEIPFDEYKTIWNAAVS